MKNTLKYFFAVAVITLSSCNNNPLEEKQKMLKEAKEQMVELKNKIATLEKEIASLDTTPVSENGASVETSSITLKKITHTVEVHGVIEASKNILVNPEVAGKIIDIKVKEGDKVYKDQTIAIIDASTIIKSIEELEKGLEFANTIFEKQEQLYQKGIGTEVQYLEAKNRKESLEKSLASLQSQREKFVIKAPVSGYIDDIMPKIGESANPQMPLVRLVNLENVSIESDISEALLGKVKEGDKVSVIFPSINKKTNGKIIQTGQFIDPNNRTFKIKISLDEQNQLFKPNLLAQVLLTDYESSNAIVVPSSIIQNDTKGYFIFVANSGTALKKYVKTGQSTSSETEIIEGLALGDEIIIKGFKGLINGEKLILKK